MSGRVYILFFEIYRPSIGSRRTVVSGAYTNKAAVEKAKAVARRGFEATILPKHPTATMEIKTREFELLDGSKIDVPMAGMN